MTIEVRVPTLPESVADAVVLSWHKQPGEAVQRDEVLVDIETDKVVLEVPAPADGVLQEIVEADGQTVTADQVLAIIGDGAGKTTAAPAPAAAAAAPAASKSNGGDGAAGMGPAARKLIAEHGLDASQISGSGKGGRITKEDVVQHMEQTAAPAPAAPDTAAAQTPAPAAPAAAAPMAGAVTLDDEQRPQKRVPMTRLRARIAERLLHASQSTAMLTTFNEINMKPLMDLRAQYKEQFEKAHGVRFGFMSMFVKACAEALKRFPEINASIDGNDIVYHGFVDVGVAVSSDRGLVVPVLRDAEHMTLAQIEATVRDFGGRARDGKLTLEEMTGGTFTITNGGVFGSLLSTPILNPPQSAILGMHAIQERPVVEDGEIVVRPMMYVALSYDHRIVDGQGAVTFLRTIKELVEDPHRILLDV
jgi:2-oxoglutarate dehydrogenase E2 component (dihydrolipoamide succinyltransferase)